MASIFADLRYALGSLRKSPGFSIVVILTLAVGIGANVAMFSITDAVLFRSMPFEYPSRLVLGRTTYEGELAWNVSSEDFYDYRDRVEAFESLAVIRSGASEVTVTGGEEPERVPSTMVSVNLFPTLAVNPRLGRPFSVEDADLSAPGTVLVSHGYWQRRLGGESDVLGSTLVVNGTPRTVVGVMPAGFFFFQDVDLWFPMRPGGDWTGVRRFHNWTVIGRLNPGVPIEQAQGQVDVVSAQLQEAYPDSNAEKGLRLIPLQEALVSFYRPMILTLMAAIGLVLVIACGNVAGLLLARGMGRRLELSVRAALGASRGRLATQLLGESLLLALGAGCLGILLALWFQGLMLGAIPLDFLGIETIGPSVPMLASALAFSLATALIFGAVPAFSSAQADPGENLASGVRTTESGGGARLRSGLVVFQVALSLVLLIGSGLLIRSFVQLQGTDPGFEKEGLLTAQVGLPFAEYPEAEARVRFFDGLLEDIRALPEVRVAGATSMLPIKDGYSNVGAWDPENPPAGSRDITLAEHRQVLPGYFEAMGIPLLAGRDVERADATNPEPLLIINQAMARGLFGDQNPVGRAVAVDVGQEEPLTTRVVGLVGDVRMTSLAREPSWQMYYPYAQMTSTTLSLAIRTQGDPAAVTSSVRQALRARDPNIPLANIATMQTVVSESVAGPRVLMTALTLFAAVALFLAALGLYSVLAFFVARRIHEIGIRVALGATGSRVLSLVMRRGMTLVAIGLVLGLVGAFFVTRFLQDQLFQVEATDPVTFGLVSAALALVGALACLLPAWRALRIDPVRALQAE
ncbi:ABC transporter permease [Gemmatimonadota bacterium]